MYYVQAFFGASLSFDAFLIAFKIPNFMRKLFGEGAFSQAFVPILSEYYIRDSEAAALDFIDKVFGFLLFGLVLFTFVVYLFSTQVIMIFAPGYISNPQQLEFTVQLLRITFPYLTLISIAALVTAIYNCKKRFLLPAIAPVLLNICSICAATLAKQYHGTVHFIAWGVLIAGILQLSLLLFGMRGFQRLPWPQFTLNDPGVKSVIKLMSAALFGVSIMQLGLVIDTLLASFYLLGAFLGCITVSVSLICRLVLWLLPCQRLCCRIYPVVMLKVRWRRLVHSLNGDCAQLA